jgi:hypothetical protein
MRPPQFTLGRLLFAFSCVSVAVGLLALSISVPPTLGIYIEDSSLRMMFTQLAAPLIGGISGMGIGSLWDRRARGFLVGLILAFLAVYAAMTCIYVLVIREHWF